MEGNRAAASLPSFISVADCRVLMTTNVKLLRLIYQAQRNGRNCLPYGLGLSEDYRNRLSAFMHAELPDLAVSFSVIPWEDTRQSLLDMRRDEWREIVQLLSAHANVEHPSSSWMAEIVAAGCLGGDHLWRDLGLPNRQQLSYLIEVNFPQLSAANNKNMKWKKFFYKQLCEAEGGYVCRAPTCEQCTAYEECFNTDN